ADTFETGHVDAVLVRIGAALMVRVDPAARAEEVLGGAGVEPVGGECIRARQDLDPADRRRYRHRAAHAAEGAGAATRGVEAVGDLGAKAHGAAVAGAPDLGRIEVHAVSLPFTDGARRWLPEEAQVGERQRATSEASGPRQFDELRRPVPPQLRQYRA